MVALESRSTGVVMILGCALGNEEAIIYVDDGVGVGLALVAFGVRGIEEPWLESGIDDGRWRVALAFAKLDPWVGKRLPEVEAFQLGRLLLLLLLLLLDCDDDEARGLCEDGTAIGRSWLLGVAGIALGDIPWVLLLGAEAAGTVEFGLLLCRGILLLLLLLLCGMVGTGLSRWLLGDAMGPRLLLCPDSVSLITAGDRPSISQGLGFGTPVSTATGFNTCSGSRLGPFSILLGLAVLCCF
jgi:hypothetical protein